MSESIAAVTTPSTDVGRRRATGRFTAWPLWAVATGVTGLAATIFTDSRPPAEMKDDKYTVRVADVFTVDQSTLFLSMVLGYLTVALLLITAASWRRNVESTERTSTAAHLVPFGLVASAGALALAFGWRGALANYMPGGADAGAYDVNGLWVFYMLNDFSAYIGWVPAGISIGAIAWMSLRERSVSLWIGVICALYVVGIFGAVAYTGVPGLPGTLAAIVLAITGLGLAFGRSAITQRAD